MNILRLVGRWLLVTSLLLSPSLHPSLAPRVVSASSTEHPIADTGHADASPESSRSSQRAYPQRQSQQHGPFIDPFYDEFGFNEYMKLVTTASAEDKELEIESQRKTLLRLEQHIASDKKQLPSWSDREVERVEADRSSRGKRARGRPGERISTWQKRFYDKYGFLIIRGVFTEEEVAFYRQSIICAIKTEMPNPRPRGSNGPFVSTCNNWERSRIVSHFILNSRLARIAGELMGVDGVRLYGDVSFVKGPNDNPSPAHQDRLRSLVHTNFSMITAWLPLTYNVTFQTGALDYLPCSHLQGKIGTGAKFAPCSVLSPFKSCYTARNLSMDAEMAGMGTLNKWKSRLECEGEATFFSPAPAYDLATGGLRPGDVALHDGWLIHGAPGNAYKPKRANDRSIVRGAISIQYVEDGAVRNGATTPVQKTGNDGSSYVWGDLVSEGAPIDTPYTPLLWRRASKEADSEADSKGDNETQQMVCKDGIEAFDALERYKALRLALLAAETPRHVEF
jgi:ectoine hydroxylase-related dioxygenase (phytanoyl-CoA dioxygenase family)